MKKIFLLLLILFLSSTVFSKCASSPDEFIFIGFWNLENLFDTTDDPQKNDEDFLPSGIYDWTEERLERKMYNLARVIRSMNDNNGPDILGVCELEHQYLLDSMSNNFLSDFKYQSVALESPDNRGIDNGLMFKSDKFKLLSVRGDTVLLSDRYNTRLILHVTLQSLNKDTLEIFVNHWPSRRGGEEDSEPNRIDAANTLRNSIDSILKKNPMAKIIVLGDFNDEPTNTSILKTLKAMPLICDSVDAIGLIEDQENNLFNTAYEKYASGIGSFKYRENWNMLDQIIISKELLIGNSLLYACSSFEVYKPHFMVTQTGQFQGTPLPTFGGRRYLGGYSDHFPVTAIFKYVR